jgi:alpha-beta hydrolase superfamily lysophospholipase
VRGTGPGRIRRSLALLASALVGAMLSVVAVYIVIVTRMPDLTWCQTEPLPGEFSAAHASDDFAQYMERESLLFAALDERLRERGADIDARRRYDRCIADSPSNAAKHDRNWNRTQQHRPANPRGGVLLIHGLSDSPYSMRATTEIFVAEGFHTLALRVPGHGTIPAGLTETTAEDWRAAVKIAAREITRSLPADRPFVLAGYSNGGALALDYVVRSMLEGGSDRVPDAVVLYAPAIGLSSVARYASLQRRLSAVPGLEKLAWTSIQPEFDPYKYNSFSINAAVQIYRLTSELDARLGRLAADPDTLRFPQLLVFQSVVDATLPPRVVVDQLFARLAPDPDAHDRRSELVVFDLNRIAEIEEMLKVDPATAIEALTAIEPLTFDLSVISNADSHTRGIVERRRRAGTPAAAASWHTTRLDLAWPPSVFSLSHLAMPVPPDDPIYGTGGDTDDPRHLRLGGLEMRGERGVLAVSMDQLMRLRYNPFFSYQARRLRELIDRLAATNAG